MLTTPRHTPAIAFPAHSKIRREWSAGRAISLVLLACSPWFATLDVCADSQPGPNIERVTVGIQGHYKSGFWCPVRIEVTGGEQACRRNLSLTTVDGDGVPVEHVWAGDAAIPISARTSQTIERCIKIGRRIPRLAVTLSDPENIAPAIHRQVELPAPLNSERELIVSWGPAVGLEEAFERRLRSASESTLLCLLRDVRELPNSPLGYDAVNTLVMATSDAGKLQEISSQQMTALHEWVKQGGKIVLFVGARGEAVIGPQGTFVALTLGAFQQVIVLRNSSPLETYSGSGQRLAVAPPAEGIPMTLLRDVRGQIELFDLGPTGQRPMIVRSAFGFGQVVFVAFDLDQPPFVGWEGRPRFVQRVLHESLLRPDGGEGFAASRQVVQFGYQDMSGQLRSALDQFPGITSVAFSWVAALALVYVLLIGPADYFLLHDGLKRMHWTWFTFPVMVGVFVVLAVMLNQSFKGNQIRANHLDLVDVDTLSGAIRGTTWSHIYSPRAALYDVDVQPDRDHLRAKSPATRLVAWHGLPGTALGGFDGGPAVQVGSKTAYRLEFMSPDSAKVRGIPMTVASTQSLLTRWQSTASFEQQSKLTRDADGLLRGEVVNPLDVELHECMVLYENWLYRLDSRRGVLRAGERTQVDVERGLNFQWRLSGRRVVDSKDISTPWDQNTLSVDKILEMMMFHSAAGGEVYTQLKNHYQHYVDLSQHLKSGRAILVGRARAPATTMTLNEAAIADPDEQHWTYYRVIFPVDIRRD